MAEKNIGASVRSKLKNIAQAENKVFNLILMKSLSFIFLIISIGLTIGLISCKLSSIEVDQVLKLIGVFTLQSISFGILGIEK